MGQEISIRENAVLGDQELQQRLMNIDPEFGEFCIRVSGEVFGKPHLDQSSTRRVVSTKNWKRSSRSGKSGKLINGGLQ